MQPELRQRIVDEATRLFGQKGYGSTSVRELVEAVGATKPTLYYYFGSKEGLFLETAQGHLQALDTLARDALASAPDLSGKLEALLLANVQYASEHPDTLRFLMTCLHQVEHGQPDIDLMSIDATVVRYLGEVFYAAAEGGEISVDIDVPLSVISFLGILRAWTLAAFHGAPAPAGFHRTVVHQFLHGIVPR